MVNGLNGGGSSPIIGPTEPQENNSPDDPSDFDIDAEMRKWQSGLENSTNIETDVQKTHTDIKRTDSDIQKKAISNANQTDNVIFQTAEKAEENAIAADLTKDAGVATKGISVINDVSLSSAGKLRDIKLHKNVDPVIAKNVEDFGKETNFGNQVRYVYDFESSTPNTFRPFRKGDNPEHVMFLHDSETGKNSLRQNTVYSKLVKNIDKFEFNRRDENGEIHRERFHGRFEADNFALFWQHYNIRVAEVKKAYADAAKKAAEEADRLKRNDFDQFKAKESDTGIVQTARRDELLAKGYPERTANKPVPQFLKMEAMTQWAIEYDRNLKRKEEKRLNEEKSDKSIRLAQIVNADVLQRLIQAFNLQKAKYEGEEVQSHTGISNTLHVSGNGTPVLIQRITGKLANNRTNFTASKVQELAGKILTGNPMTTDDLAAKSAFNAKIIR